jgi:hypothetical protein
VTGQEGQCGLCLRPAVLQESHLLPAAVYRLMRGRTDGPNSSLVHVTTTKSFRSDKQITEYFLCRNCEQRFSVNGENYVLRHCDRQNGKFRLRELLRSHCVLFDLGEDEVFDVTALLGEKTEQYIYFGASVFWRAAARSWTFRGTTVAPLKLGTYQEELRLYLLGEAGFPANGRLFVNVSSDDRTDVATPPGGKHLKVGRHEGPYYKFYIPGILFTLILGRELAQECDAIALNSSKGKFMLLSPWKDDSLFHHIAATAEQSTPRGWR